MKSLFEERVLETLARATAVFTERGQQYGDTWRDFQFLALKATARELGSKIDDKHCRAIAAAVMVDTKYQRLQGGYKEDSLDDGINFAAYLAAEIRAVKEAACVSGGSVSES